jgi:hypothetical protein
MPAQSSSKFGCGVSEPRNFTRIARETPLKVLRSNAHANYFRLKARQIQEHLNGLPVHRSKFGCSTSELGQKQTWERVHLMSALPPKADIPQRRLDVRFVPQTDSCTAANESLSDQIISAGENSLAEPLCQSP